MNGIKVNTAALQVVLVAIKGYALRRGKVMMVARTTSVITGMSLLMTIVFAGRAAAVCPNENLRGVLGTSSALPDCRAYEMISPSYKEGYSMFPLSYSVSGDQVISSSLATLVGSQGSGESVPEAALYISQRASGSWQTTPTSAPLTAYVGQIPLAYEATSGLTLWDQHTPRQPAATRGLYIRNVDGTYSFVGPLNPVAGNAEEESDVIEATERNYDRPVAATSDFRHIVLYAPSPDNYWTNIDATAGAGGSLYELSGTGNSQPILVGVTGDEKGSTHLIGKCGVQLGGGLSGSVHNALSSDGETVFFSVQAQGERGCLSAEAPNVTELYARTGGSLLSASRPNTVNIGESECTEECGNESGKNFEGASSDGASVFFTSTQKLTDSAADGTEAGSKDAAVEAGCAVIESAPGCNLYLYDFHAPEHERLTFVAGEVLGVTATAEDGSRVYFVSRAATLATGVNPYGAKAQTGMHNLYVYDAQTHETEFVAILGNETELWQREFFRPVATADDGHILLFASSTPGVTGPEDTATTTQLFEYATATVSEPAELVRVTKGEQGYGDNGEAVAHGVPVESIALLTQRQGRKLDFLSSSNSLDISQDGRTVVFESAGELSPRARPAAVKGCSSVYEFRTDGALSAGSVHLLSDGVDVQPNKGSACGAQFLGMDASGDNVLISTADSLLAQDTNGVQRDVYDVRVDGGFPPVPVSGESGQCVVGGCEGSSSGGVFAPGLPSSLTAGVEGNSVAAQFAPSGGVHRKSVARNRAGGLSRALRVCRRERGKLRHHCEGGARRRFGSAAVAGRGK